MTEQQNEALIERVPSEETVLSAGHRRSSNGKALKVAGLTLLACLLLAGQALTTYFVWGQREHINALKEGQENLKTALTRKSSGGAPKAMHLPMNSMPMLTDLTDEKSSVPLTKLNPGLLIPREGSGLLDEAARVMPRKMHLPMGSLPLLMNKYTDVKATEASATEVRTKCQLETVKEVRPGFFRPECDEQGNYKPMQCWHSTGYCWCVDKNGAEVPNTRVRGRPKCDSADIQE